jgi:type I restriction enzyme S subunit
MIKGLKPYSAMKASGVPWLGDVPEHWHLERAKWLFRKRNRPVREQDDVVTCFRDGTVTLRTNRRTRGFTESLKEIGYQGIRRGDLVVHAMDAFAGAVGVADADGKGTPVYSVCEPGPLANPHYYASAIREMARSQWIQALAKGIRERSTDFRFEAFGNQPVPLPPPSEQAAIVRFLDHADRRIRRYIRAKQKLIKLLEEQKQAIIHRAVTRGLDPNVRLKPSGVERIGDVPEHWEVVALKRVLRRLVDCEHKTAPAVDQSDCHVVRTTAVRRGQLKWAGTYCTSLEAFKLWTRRSAPEAGDVIFTREAPAGEACLVPENVKVCLGQRTVLMKVLRDRYVGQFLVHMIYAGPPRLQIQLASQGSTVGHFNMDDIGWMEVLVPPLLEQKEIVGRLAQETQSIVVAADRAESEIALLREYRTRLIADVVTGKIDVREAAARLPDEVDEVEPEAPDESESAEAVEEVEDIAEVEG